MGFRATRIVHDLAELDAVHHDIHRGEGPLFAQLKVAPDKLPLVLPPRDGAHLKNRFRETLLGPAAFA
jgi:hypothetical protein